jgi:hypothetical protein
MRRRQRPLAPLYQGPAICLDDYNHILQEQGRKAAQAYLEGRIARGIVKVIPRDGPARPQRARTRAQ